MCIRDRNKLVLDFIAYHIYTDKISDIEQLISSYDKCLLENGFLHTERILDEWNYFGDEDFEGVLWDACRTNPHAVSYTQLPEFAHEGPSGDLKRRGRKGGVHQQLAFPASVPESAAKRGKLFLEGHLCLSLIHI